MTRDTSALEPKSSASPPLVKLSRMLRSIVRRYPLARLWTTQAGFGVSLDAQTYVQVSYSGRWTDADMRDLHALFAVWLVADPARLLARGVPLVGASHTEPLEFVRSSMQEDSSGTQ